MNRHPGGEAQTLHLLEYVKFRKGMEALDLGAGEGETVRILKSLGINAHGVDLSPRSRDVQKGDFLNLDYTAESMDLCISQCAFFVSGDQQKAVSECWRVLKKGGLLVLSDLDQGNLVEVVKCTEYYLEAIWNDSFCCEEYKLLQKQYKGKKLSYTAVIGRKE